MSPHIPLVVPQQYGYVLLTASSTFFIGLWHSMRVGLYRRKSGVPYPNSYADNAMMSAADDPAKKRAMHLFNCAQRAHSNYLEHSAAVAAALLVSGIRYPVAASTAGLVWGLGRIVYAVGYTWDSPGNKNGAYRIRGAFHMLAALTLFGLTGLSGWKLLTA